MFKLIYIPWILGILLAIYFLYRALKRIVKGIISYRRLGKEEFMKRLRDGFDGITPSQKTRGEINGIIISLIGMLIGVIVMSIIRIKNIWYWAVISLGGGAIVTIWQLIGKVQLYRAQKKQDDLIKQMEVQNEHISN